MIDLQWLNIQNTRFISNQLTVCMRSLPRQSSFLWLSEASLQHYDGGHCLSPRGKTASVQIKRSHPWNILLVFFIKGREIIEWSHPENQLLLSVMQSRWLLWAVHVLHPCAFVPADFTRACTPAKVRFCFVGKQIRHLFTLTPVSRLFLWFLGTFCVFQLLQKFCFCVGSAA